METGHHLTLKDCNKRSSATEQLTLIAVLLGGHLRTPHGIETELIYTSHWTWSRFMMYHLLANICVCLEHTTGS